MATDALFRLDGRTAIVTGGTRGIGRAIAGGLAEAGASVTVASRDADACRQTADELRRAGHDALGHPCHMASSDDIDAVVAATVERWGGVDIVVNNAATGVSEPLGAITSPGFAKSFDVNVRGPMLLLQAAVPHLKESSHASVVNVVSAGAWLFLAPVAVYSASKAALVSFTRSAAAALAADGIRVNALAPGMVETDMMRRGASPFMDDLVRSSLLQRPASPEEMVGPTIFLASDASSFMTGGILHVDGGTVAH